MLSPLLVDRAPWKVELSPPWKSWRMNRSGIEVEWNQAPPYALEGVLIVSFGMVLSLREIGYFASANIFVLDLSYEVD